MRNGLAPTIFMILLGAAAPCGADAPLTVPPRESVARKTQAEWSVAWWQWAGSFDGRDSPVADTTGALCASHQRGPVWFLAGAYGSRRTVRTCRVPHGKYLFFPLINYVVMPRQGYSSDCVSFIAEAARVTSGAEYLVMDLDGQRLGKPEAHRQASPCFDMGALASPKENVYPSAANGYYVMLKPLSVGTHELNFGGVLPQMHQAITYTLIVE
jgi:hypothetical protein